MIVENRKVDKFKGIVNILSQDLIRKQSETISFQPTNCFFNPESLELRKIIHYVGT